MKERAESLDARAYRFWLRYIDLRTASAVLTIVMSWWLPFMPEYHSDRLTVILSAVVVYNVGLDLRLRRHQSLDAWMPVGEVVMFAVVAGLIPSAWAPLLCVSIADVGLAVVVFGRRTAIATALAGTVSLGVVAAVSIDGGASGVIGFAYAAALMVLAVGAVHENEELLRKRFSAIVNGVQGIVWEQDTATGEPTFVSAAAASILGWSEDEIRDTARWAEEAVDLRVLEKTDTTLVIERRVRRGDGSWIWLRDHGSVEYDANGVAIARRGVSFDVTAEHEADETIKRYANIVEELQLSLFVWRLEDPDDDLSVVAVSANPAAVGMSRPASGSLVGKRVVDLWPAETAPTFSRMLARSIRDRRPLFLPEVPYDLGGQPTKWFSVRVFPLPDECVGMLSEDVTEQHDAAVALRHQALHDSLTGLPNRALLRDRLTTALSTARRTGQPVALLVLDLDQFKEINDTLGHPTGDRMLQQVAARLSDVLRDCDSVARLGGDEFAVLLTVDASRTGAENVAVRISDALAAPFDLDGLSVQTAASIGIVLSPEHGADAELLVQRADVAMYGAKRGSRSYAFYAPEDDRSSVRRLSLVGELRQAIDRGELVLHYQPQIDASSGAVVGIEALVRWQHPEHGLLPPAEFIALAEVSGIIQPLTQWVVRTAAMQGAELVRLGHQVVMGVNVSARNLYEPDLVAGIEQDLLDSALPPELLMLELTESELVDDPSQVMTVLSLVSEKGVRLAIDDFGTGWSSLSNLTQLPIHQVKIDRSFVSRMVAGGDDAVIVRSIIDLGHNLGLEVVAEGVEDTATLNALRDLGCDQAQGYLIARPMPAADLVPWLDRAALAVIGSL